MLCKNFSINRFRFSARFYGLITEAMIKQGVVPDVIDCPPEERAEINYDNGVTVRDGNILTPTQVKRAPIVKWTTVCGCFYTVCMIDPDAPSRAKPELREWQHWLVVNIPSGKVRAGESIFAYIGSGPPKGTGYHRYVFLIYKQPEKLYFEEPRINSRNATLRPKFSIKNFAKKYELGSPIAGNFFIAQYDNYVPILYQKICCT